MKTVFNIIRAHQLKMNPTKSFLGVASGKFLGFVVTSKEFTSTQRKFMPSRRYNFQGTLESLEDCKGD